MNTLGKIFRISVFGESHGEGVGVIIDGCPPGIMVDQEMLLRDIDRRKSGKKGTTPRKEYDMPIIMSGVFKGYTTGAPIMIMTENTNKRSPDYNKFADIPRPGHTDMVADQKYGGFSDTRGSGHFSGRLTWSMVAAGAIARKIIEPIVVEAGILSVGGNENIEEEVDRAVSEKDSVGGLIECIASGMPVGLGEPLYYSLEAVVSSYIYSIPAIKGLEFGSGFRAAAMRGSEHNDLIENKSGKTKTNNAGGVNGGISNGNDLVLRVAVKPPSSISRPQKTYNRKTGKIDLLEIEGRHDACIALRIPVIIESAVSLALADLVLINKAIYGGKE